MEKKLLITTFTEKLEKVTKFFNISKTYKGFLQYPFEPVKQNIRQKNAYYPENQQNTLKTSELS